jgi:hypothetical protein
MSEPGSHTLSRLMPLGWTHSGLNEPDRLPGGEAGGRPQDSCPRLWEGLATAWIPAHRGTRQDDKIASNMGGL